MNWKKFKELDKEYPEVIVEKKIAGFDNATDGLASLGIVKLDGVQALNAPVSGDFKFALYLYSPNLKGYKFNVLYFGYDIRLSPIDIKIEDSIDEEIRRGSASDKVTIIPLNITIRTNEDFQKLLDTIFSSNAFESVVGGLLKVAKKSH